MNSTSPPQEGHVVIEDKSSDTTDLSPDMATSKEGIKIKLIVCFLGIFVSYFVCGILQERITRGEYGEGEKAERFTFTLVLVFVQCVINTIFAQSAIQYTRPDRDLSPQKYYAVMAFSYLGAMVASNHALQYIPYPTQVLGKSAKPIPVMLLGVLLAKKRYPIQKYLFVLMIVIGVAMFLYKDKKGVDTGDQGFTFGSGEMLLLVSLFLDGVTGGIQDKLRGEHRTQTHRMMLYMNTWSVAYLGAAILVTGQGLEFIAFAQRHPYVIFNLLTFSLSSALGQNFIFMTVTNFGPLTCSIFTTTRKFFTILASVVIFQNPIVLRQWLGTSFVFIGLGLDSVYGKEQKQKKEQS